MAEGEAEDLYRGFGALAGGVAHMILSASRIASGVTNLRMEGFLSRSSLSHEIRSDLRRAPANTDTLFAGEIPTALEKRYERQQQDLSNRLASRDLREKLNTPRKGGSAPSTPNKTKPQTDFRGGGRGRRSTPRSPAPRQFTPQKKRKKGKGRGKQSPGRKS